MMNDLQKDLCELECIDRRSGVDRRTADTPLLPGADKRSCIDRRNGFARRSTHRFQVKNFIFVKLWSELDEDIGQLLDISSNGLSFRYMSDNEAGSFSKLSILTNNTIVIPKIPFKTISDIELQNGLPSMPIIFRRCGVQFGQLSSHQQFQLEQFLKYYGEVPNI